MQENKQHKTVKGGNNATGRKQRQKMLIAVLIMLVPFSAGMYFIFRSAHSAMPQDAGGLDVSIPDGRGVRIEASKTKALAHVESEEEERRRMQRFDSDSFSLLDTTEEEPVCQADALAGVREAHAEAARTISGFYGEGYKAPENDARIEALQRQVEQLNERLDDRFAVPNPAALAEQQYALAAKYFGHSDTRPPEESAPARSRAAKDVRRVCPLPANVVSSLASQTSDTITRRTSFHTAVGNDIVERSQAIRASVDEERTLRSGDRVRLRLQDDILAGGYRIPAGTLLYGTVDIARQRLHVRVSGIEHGGDVIAVSLTAYDLDGAEGLYIPDSDERTAAKDAAAAVASGLGTGITIARNAGQQVVMDATRGLLSGGSQYLSTKLRQVKVSVKSGYELLLVSTDN